MDIEIRPATAADHAGVVEFTTGTFPWGDYVPDQFLGWLGQPDSQVFVAVDQDQRPVGLVRAVLLSDKEAWLHAARVHPDARRQGLATRVTASTLQWAADQGAQVARLLTESWNEPARAQVERSGFRAVSEWVYGERAIAQKEPKPKSNGGRRVPSGERLNLAHKPEIEPAFLAWMNSDLMAVARGLFATNWLIQQITPTHLEQAASEGRFWESRAGWLLGKLSDDAFHVNWISTTAEDCEALLKAALDRATARDKQSLTVLLPNADFVVAALERISATTTFQILWEKSL